MTKKFLLTIAIVLVVMAVSGCHHRDEAVECLPAEPDYADSTQWYTVWRGGEVDLFYIVSTENGDYMNADSIVCHYADTRYAPTRDAMNREMVGVDNLLGGNLNFVSPYYRQCTMESFTSDSLMRQRTVLPMDDLKRAFRYYLDTLSCGRPFVLMGFSQGAIGVVELLREMDSAAYSRMVAAYVIGWKVTAEDLAHPYVRPAHDSADIGVTICYNSVRSAECAIPIISEGNMVAINPVNWQTDATPATLPCRISDDTLTVTLDTASRLLAVDGYSRQDHVLPLIGLEGNYHSLELSFYSDVLRHNIALRARMWNDGCVIKSKKTSILQ